MSVRLKHNFDNQLSNMLFMSMNMPNNRRHYY